MVTVVDESSTSPHGLDSRYAIKTGLRSIIGTFMLLSDMIKQSKHPLKRFWGQKIRSSQV